MDVLAFAAEVAPLTSAPSLATTTRAAAKSTSRTPRAVHVPAPPLG